MVLSSTDKNKVLVDTTENLLYGLVNREIGFSITDNQCYIKYHDTLIPLGSTASSLNMKGTATCAQIDSMQGMSAGDIYSMLDTGLIHNPNGSTLSVEQGDLIYYSDNKWNMFLHLDLSGYVTDAQFEEAIASLRSAISAANSTINRHVSDTQNPHHVTAAQVGAYTKDEVDAEIKKESDARELYDTQLRESIEALEEKTGDFVTGEEVSAAISAEADARIQEDIALNARIDMIPQTDWDEEDEGSMAYLQNHPQPISDLDIEALFS